MFECYTNQILFNKPQLKQSTLCCDDLNAAQGILLLLFSFYKRVFSNLIKRNCIYLPYLEKEIIKLFWHTVESRLPDIPFYLAIVGLETPPGEQ